MPKSNSPGYPATNDDTLPQTAVRMRGKDLLVQQLQDKLAEYDEPVAQPEMTPQEEENFKKRYGDLRRHAQAEKAQAQKEINELRNQINQLVIAQNQPLPKTREEFEAWKNKYPDIVSFIEIIAEERAAAAKADLGQELDTVKSKLNQTEKEKSYATLKVLVPDLETILAAGHYKNWFTNQPMFIQEILNTSDDPHKIAYYLNIYKQTTTPTTPASKSDKLKALDMSVKNTGTAPSGNSGKWKFTQKQIQNMSTEEYTSKEDAIIEARNAGLILDDVSRRNSVFDI